MGSSAPPPPDYKGAAIAQSDASRGLINQQTQANRPNISTPFASQTWTQGPGGQWNMSSQLNPAFQGTANSLAEQAQQSISQPFSFGQFGQLGNGDAARDQAITGAYNQATSRLNPQWSQQQEQLDSRLAAQGLDPGSQAYRNAQQQFGTQRNDAYSSAMNSAIGQGTAAQQATFGENMAARQQAIQEALSQRNLPLQTMAQMQGLLATPGFNAAGAAQAPNLFGAAQAGGEYGLQANQIDNQRLADIISGGGELLKAAPGLFALSDEREKTAIERLSIEALPGVPFASWEYRFMPGRRFVGVIAQDLERVAPKFVATAPNGLKFVDYSFLVR